MQIKTCSRQQNISFLILTIHAVKIMTSLSTRGWKCVIKFSQTSNVTLYGWSEHCVVVWCQKCVEICPEVTTTRLGADVSLVVWETTQWRQRITTGKHVYITGPFSPEQWDKMSWMWKRWKNSPVKYCSVINWTWSCLRPCYQMSLVL